MQNGTPSVTTTIGAEGMHSELPWNGFVSDDPIDFANKAVELYSTKTTWEKAQQNGVRIINQIYDKEKLSVPLSERIKYLQTHIDTHRTQNFIGTMLQYHTLKSNKYLSKWIEEKGKKF